MNVAVSVQTQTAKPQALSTSKHAGMLLQRKCACGSPTFSLTGACPECPNKPSQTKLRIGASNDPLEQEADRAADQVMRAGTDPAINNTPPRIQRFTGHSSGENGTAPASIDRVLAGTGSPLEPALQQDMGQRFGYDFSRVRVHSDAAAEQSAREMNAKAYTVGHHVVFAAGQFAPRMQQGRRLLAHELAHVVQQSGGVAIGANTCAGNQEPAEVRPLQAGGVFIARKKPTQESKAEIAKSKKQRDAIALFWSDVHAHFPGEGRKLAGTGYDDTVDYLTTSFQKGESMEGGVRISRSAPIVYVGNKYLAEPDIDKRKAAIKAELDKIDLFRFDEARIDNDDLNNTVITGKLGSLNIFGKRDYLQKLEAQKSIKNDKVKEYIRRTMPSTPLQEGAVATAEGGFSLQFENIKIVVKPDVFNSTAVAADEAHTELKRVDTVSYKTKPGYTWGKDQKVNRLTYTPFVPQLIYKVETHFGPQSAPTYGSGYGVGTRPEDAAGDKSLRVHEGTHGAAFIGFIKTNIAQHSFPVFDGKLGENKDDFEKKIQRYESKVLAFDQMLKDAIEASEQQVDCVGKTIEQYHTEKGTASKVKCKQSKP